MRASVEPIRDLTLDVLDVAQRQAAGLVDAGAGRLAAGIGTNVDRLAAGIEELADKAPVVTLEVGRRRSRRPLVIVLLVLVGGAIAFSVLKRKGAGPRPSDPPAGVREPVNA